MDVMTTVEGKISVITDSANGLINDGKRAVGVAEDILLETKDITRKINSIGEGSKFAKKAFDIFAMLKGTK
jgi:hypothetical protein